MVQRRTIQGTASLLVPLDGFGDPDWETFSRLLDRVVKLGLRPGVNLCPFAPALRDASFTIGAVHQAQQVSGGQFYAGVHVDDKPGEWFNADRYKRQIDDIASCGGTPVVFPSHGLNALDASAWLNAVTEMSLDVDGFVLAEVAPPLASSTSIRPLEATIGLVRNRRCRGILHLSWSRSLEFSRLAALTNLRRDFRVWTGNERAIDMAMFGPDYMLMTAGMAPELFARRDRFWAEGNPDVYELNDVLQYVGNFASRAPVEALPHSVLQMLRCRGLVASDVPPAGVSTRPASDVAVLEEMLTRIEELQ